MSKTLDRSKDFAQICGGNGEARYEQDGNQFDASDNLIGGDVSAAAGGKKGKATAPVVDTPAVDMSDLDLQLLQQGAL